MCQICMSVPCRAGCPNADPEPVCEKCEKKIRIGSKYYEGYNGLYCKDCLEDMDFDELIEKLGVYLETA